MPLKDARHCAAVISLLAYAFISTSAASADLVRLADILAPVLTASQFAVLCRAADPNFGDVRGSLGTVQTYARHMRDEILDGLPQDQAGVVLTSAADRARSTARERLHAFAFSQDDVNVSALANWCQGSARLYIRTVLAGHDNDHDAMKARPSRTGEQARRTESRSRRRPNPQNMMEDDMHTHSTSAWEHQHFFLGNKHDRHERRTMFVVALTAAMMVTEIIGGTAYGSMALVADGWHMSTHAAALGIAALAYRFARVHAHSSQFSFGTGKLGELAAFASAIILAMIALFIGYESVTRLYQPVTIRFSEALPIAALGLVVNLVSAWLLHDDHSHSHPADYHDDHAAHAHGDGHHHDSNIRAAYVHVMADALTSVLAIVALLAGRFYGVTWLDPVMGLIGMAVILAWSWSLVRSAGAVLLDAVPDASLSRHIREHLEIEGDRVSDLHTWRLGPGHVGLIASVVSDRPQSPDIYKQRVAHIRGLAHVTVEVHKCGAHIRERHPNC